MYLPNAFAITSAAEIVEALRRVAFGHLVSDDGSGTGRLESTPLPFLVDDAVGELRGHFARANPHWKNLDGKPALMIVAGPDGYVSPRWYPSKAEHGKVVPTWNYEVIHLRGVMEIHDDPEWTRALVSELTDQNEPRVNDPQHRQAWAVTDAPSDFIDAQLKAIVGVRLVVTEVEAKHKLSQNRTGDDRSGATAGLERVPGTTSLAALMRWPRPT